MALHFLLSLQSWIKILLSFMTTYYSHFWLSSIFLNICLNSVHMKSPVWHPHPQTHSTNSLLKSHYSDIWYTKCSQWKHRQPHRLHALNTDFKQQEVCHKRCELHQDSQNNTTILFNPLRWFSRRVLFWRSLKSPWLKQSRLVPAGTCQPHWPWTHFLLKLVQLH